MAKISALSLLGAAPADNDEFVILDVSDTTQGANGSTKALAASRVARTGVSNTFEGGQIINRSGVKAMEFILAADNSTFSVEPWDNGSSRGGRVVLGRNSNASTPASGQLEIQNAAASNNRYRIWVDASGNLRIWNGGEPTNAFDTSGTVVGTQTSWYETKSAVLEWDGAEALDAIRALTLYSYQMVADGQKTPSGEKPTYYGIVITEEDRENNAWFGLGYGENQVPVLNDRNLFGYMLAAIRHGGNIINELQSQVAALTARVEALEGAE